LAFSPKYPVGLINKSKLTVPSSIIPGSVGRDAGPPSETIVQSCDSNEPALLLSPMSITTAGINVKREMDLHAEPDLLFPAINLAYSLCTSPGFLLPFIS